MSREMDLIRDQHDFRFTRNWFRTRNLGTFREFVHPQWAGKPIVYLELGVFEGISLVWMMQHILTHPDSRAVGVDPWLMTAKLTSFDMEEVMDRAFHNVEPWRFPTVLPERCTLVRSNSAEALLRMRRRGGFWGIRKDSLDLCLIDGDHQSGAVLDDCRGVFQLMKVGGWMLFDDVENDKQKDHHVKEGLGLFLEEKGQHLKRVWKNKYVEAFEKVS